jgi:phage gp46-like protein
MTATNPYQGDALWGPCPDGGDIMWNGGEPQRSGGLSGAVYISLMGGNQRDTGELESKQQYWGNHLEADTNRHIRGRTGTLIAGIPLSSGNLVRITKAADQDLAWMISTGVATSVLVEATIEAARRVVITVIVESRDDTETFVYRENWLAGPTEPPLSCAA